MADKVTFQVPADAPDRDLRRVRQEAEVAQRNAKIKRQYATLMESHERPECLRRLADRFPVSKRQVRRIIYGA